MKHHPSLLRTLAVGLALVGLSSCSLPPSTAWRLIRQDGLGNYLAMEFGRKPFPPEVQSQRFIARNPAHAPAPSFSPNAVAIQSPYLNSSNAPATVPPVSPAPVSASASRLVFQVPAPLPAPAARQPSMENSPVAKPNAKPQPSVAESPKPAAEPPKKAPTTSVATAPKKPATAPASTAATPAPRTTPAPAAAKQSSLDLPYGSPVPGRVGLVHSPYAGKLQLVDVAGLAPGQEVKCPYSGKLFRVPSGDQAAAAKTESTPPPPAKTEDAKKQ